MFRRTYYVQRAERRNDGEQMMRDTSFTSFMCILFIFVLFTCLIVIASNWRYLFLVENEIEYFAGSNKYDKIIIDPSGTKPHRPAWLEEEETTSFVSEETTTFDSTTDTDVAEITETVESTTATSDYTNVDAEASHASERIWNDAAETVESTDTTETTQSTGATETKNVYDDYDESSRTTDWKRDTTIFAWDLIDLDVTETRSAWSHVTNGYDQDTESTQTTEWTTGSTEATETAEATDLTDSTNDISSSEDKTTGWTTGSTEITDSTEEASESTVLTESTSDSDYYDESSSQTTVLTPLEAKFASIVYYLYNLRGNTAETTETTTETNYDYNDNQSSSTEAGETTSNEDSTVWFFGPSKTIESSEVDLQFGDETIDVNNVTEETTVRPQETEQVYGELSKFKGPGQMAESDPNDRSAERTESTYRMELSDSSEVTDQYDIGEIN